jgi:hypothetical protein
MLSGSDVGLGGGLMPLLSVFLEQLTVANLARNFALKGPEYLFSYSHHPLAGPRLESAERTLYLAPLKIQFSIIQVFASSVVFRQKFCRL